MRWFRSLAAFLAMLAPRAQEQVVVHSDGDRQICTVQLANFGGTRMGGLGFLVVEAENHDERPHAVEVSVSSPTWSGGDVAAHRALLLGPRERGQFFLPRPNSVLGTFVVDVKVDGAVERTNLSPGTADGLVGLLVSDRTDRQAWGTLVLQAMPGATSGAPTVQLARPEYVSADWRLFTGFDAVLVDGRTRLSAEQQEALRRFVFAGGTVVVSDAARLPPGALRALATVDAASPVAHGLGRCVEVAADDGDTALLRERLALLPRAGLSGWPAPDALLQEQPIPGLGEAPALVFLLVILLFAVVAGPVNFLLLRRWKRPLLVLATVPALGIGTTFVMLGYGFLHDGLGVRGVVNSWTLLDQDRHEAVSIAARTLFCGLSPSELELSADAFVLAPHAALHSSYGEPDRWHFDGDRGRLDGGALPSRRTTPLLSAQQGTARQRLRVRAQGADALEVLTDGGVDPVGDMLLRDFDGVWWTGQVPTLRRATDANVRASLDRWQREAGAMQVVTEPRMGRFGRPGELTAVAEAPTSLYPMLGRFVDGDLPRGGYVALVRAAPWLEEHGLQVDYDAASHFVVGRLAVEDFVR